MKTALEIVVLVSGVVSVALVTCLLCMLAWVSYVVFKARKRIEAKLAERTDAYTEEKLSESRASKCDDAQK